MTDVGGEKELDGLGEGIRRLPEYKVALAKHKATDMKHDGLTLGESQSFWEHFYKFIPKNVVDETKRLNAPQRGSSIANPFFKSLDDEKFMQTYLYGITDDGQPNRPILSMTDLILYCTNQHDPNYLDKFAKPADAAAANALGAGLASVEGSPIFVKFGENIIYEYRAKLQNLNFSVRDDAKSSGDRKIPASIMLNNLGIVSGSILNVDFQYHLWDLLKSGPEDTTHDIYLIMNPENINDPAGKFNMNDNIFAKRKGVNVILAKCATQENTVYSSYDKRKDFEPGPDFFSRFDVTLSGIKTVSNMCGLIKSFGVELTIQSQDDNFIYSAISKASNSNASVISELNKLYRKHPASTPGVKRDLELLMAVEAAKKGGGDDLQLLSHWNIHNRVYDLTYPTRKPKETLKNKSFLKENPIFFVSHDGPTIVRALIEGNNVLFMYSQMKGNIKIECALSLTRGKFERPPLFRTLKIKYENLRHKIGDVNTVIAALNEKRKRTIADESAKFSVQCQKPYSKTTVYSSITKLLQDSVYLCLLKSSICQIETLEKGIDIDTIPFFKKEKSTFSDLVVRLSEETEETVLLNIQSIIKTLEDKNKNIEEEENKYNADKISKSIDSKIKNSPSYFACSLWQRDESRQRGRENIDSGIIQNKTSYDIYFNNFAEYFTEDEAQLFIDSLYSSFESFRQAGEKTVTFEKFKQLVAYATTRLVIEDNGRIDTNNITSNDVEIVNKIADNQADFNGRHEMYSDISNIDKAQINGGRNTGKMLGGGRRVADTALISSNDRGLPYSVVLSRLSHVLFHSEKGTTIDENIFIRESDDAIFNEVQIPLTDEEDEEDEDEEDGEEEVAGGQSKTPAFEDLLIMGKMLNIYSPEEKKEYTEMFMRKLPNIKTNLLEKWKNFKFMNPISGFHLLFFMVGLFFEDTEDKIQTSSYLPEFFSYLFTFKKFTDEMLVLLEGVNERNIFERFKQIRAVGLLFNILVYSFTAYEEGEENISQVLDTEYSSSISRITSSILLRYAGNIEMKEHNIKNITKNARTLLKSDQWRNFMGRMGNQYFDRTLSLFREYDNSVLIFFAGAADLSKSHPIDEMETKLNVLKKVYKFESITDANMTPKANFVIRQKNMFRKLISNLKDYTSVLLEWNKMDILNQPLELLKNASPKKTSEKNTDSHKESMKRRARTPSAYKSFKRRTPKYQPAIAVSSGGKKTRRKRK